MHVDLEALETQELNLFPLLYFHLSPSPTPRSDYSLHGNWSDFFFFFKHKLGVRISSQDTLIALQSVCPVPLLPSVHVATASGHGSNITAKRAS